MIGLLLYSVGSVGFLAFNYSISDEDLFNPSFIFCGINVLAGVMLIGFKDNYGVDFCIETVSVLLTGQLLFTLVNLISNSFRLKIQRKATVNQRSSYKCQYVYIQRIWVVLFIILEVVVAYYTVQYVIDISIAYFGGFISYSNALSRYDYFAKHMEASTRNLDVYASPFMSHGKTICLAITYVLIPIEINNYFARRRFDILICIYIGLMIIVTLLTGFRSEAFIIVTAIMIDAVVIYRGTKQNPKKGNARWIIRFVQVFFCVFVFSLAIRPLIGRNVGTQSWYSYLFGYFGGPVLNLDLIISRGITKSSFWGRETFGYFINYLGWKLNNRNWIYNLNLPWEKSNGISTGNVHTMYYMFMEDFGFFGVIVLTSIAASYYLISWKKIMKKCTRGDNVLGVELFFYGYMFNSLLMLLFSNRFYENFINITTIRMLFLMFILWELIKKGYLSYKFRIPRIVLDKRKLR